MTTIYDNDILITKAEGSLYMDLECGYGQPCVTTINLKKNDGTTEQKNEFAGNVKEFIIGDIKALKYNIIEIYTTIDDIHDSQDEVQDIYLSIIVYDKAANPVSTEFTRNTKGKGSRIHSFYNVTVL